VLNKQGLRILDTPDITIVLFPELRGKHDCRHWRQRKEVDAATGESEEIYRCVICGDRWPKTIVASPTTNLGSKLKGAVQ